MVKANIDWMKFKPTKKAETRNPRDEVIQVQKKICSWALTSAVVIAFVCIFFLDKKAVGKGLLLGTLFSIINFVLMGKSIPMTLRQTRSKARMIGLGSILARYALLAIPLVVAVKSASFSFIAVAIGIFGVQIVTLVDYTIIRRVQHEK